MFHRIQNFDNLELSTASVKSITTRCANKQENGIHGQGITDDKNCPLGGPDTGFSREFKAATFNSVQFK